MRHFLYSLLAVTLMFFAMPATSSAEAVHGVLRVVKGKVQVKAIKDGKTTRAKVGQKVFPQDTIITGPDSRAKVVMIDNNEINVSPDSEVAFEKYEYKPGENKKDVLLNVIYGKVRSKVEQKYDGKTSKFQVKTPSAVAGVRGTDFITSFDLGTKETNVVTFHGAVEFKSATGGQAVIVSVGQSASASLGKSPTTPTPVAPTELKSMDKESKADTASPPAPAGGGAAGPGGSDSKDEKKNDDGAKAEGDKPEAQADAKQESGEAKQEAGDAKSEAKDTAKSEAKSDGSTGDAKSEPAAKSGDSASSEPKKGGSTLTVDKKDVPESKPDIRSPASAGPSGPTPPKPEFVKPNTPVPSTPPEMPKMPTPPIVQIPDVVKDIMQNTGPAKVTINIK